MGESAPPGCTPFGGGEQGRGGLAGRGASDAGLVSACLSTGVTDVDKGDGRLSDFFDEKPR